MDLWIFFEWPDHLDYKLIWLMAACALTAFFFLGESVDKTSKEIKRVQENVDVLSKKIDALSGDLKKIDTAVAVNFQKLIDCIERSKSGNLNRESADEEESSDESSVTSVTVEKTESRAISTDDTNLDVNTQILLVSHSEFDVMHPPRPTRFRLSTVVEMTPTVGGIKMAVIGSDCVLISPTNPMSDESDFEKPNPSAADGALATTDEKENQPLADYKIEKPAAIEPTAPLQLKEVEPAAAVEPPDQPMMPNGANDMPHDGKIFQAYRDNK